MTTLPSVSEEWNIETKSLLQERGKANSLRVWRKIKFYELLGGQQGTEQSQCETTFQSNLSWQLNLLSVRGRRGVNTGRRPFILHLSLSLSYVKCNSNQAEWGDLTLSLQKYQHPGLGGHPSLSHMPPRVTMNTVITGKHSFHMPGLLCWAVITQTMTIYWRQTFFPNPQTHNAPQKEAWHTAL